MQLVNTITDKSDWQRKVFDDAIIAKWKTEIDMLNALDDTPEAMAAVSSKDEWTSLASNESTSNTVGIDGTQQIIDHTRKHVTPKMFAWAIAEVKHKAIIFETINCVEALDGVWKSDTIIGQDLKKALEIAVQPLEAVPEDEQDWHPGSNQQVLDLVHPSMYPLVYGQSHILRGRVCHVNDCTSCIGKGFTVQPPNENAELGDEWSKKFQWLPTEFEAPDKTEDVCIKSYINNLHPKKHTRLYSIIAQVVARAIPLWDRVLSHVITPPIEPRVSDWTNSNYGYGDGANEKPSLSDGEAQVENEDEFEARYQAWKDTRPIIEPEPGKFRSKSERIRDPEKLARLIYPPGVESKEETEQSRANEHASQSRKDDIIPFVNLRKDYGQLQIIVKLANIHLSPENPEYPGGSWHVEGQANESICASALYYYSNDNITESHLSFRQQTEDGSWGIPYPQDDHRAAEFIHGIEMGEPAIQNVGKVLTCESRLLCFPNVMQHRVSPFKLADLSRPGYRKILALFLVDPNLKIISTENVPPQQHSWWREDVMATGLFQKLPPELVENVLDSIEFPVTLEKAREQRLELMDERKSFGYHADDLIESKRFNMITYKAREEEKKKKKGFGM
ncbi:MAG: hypothetical protein LQ341_006119 [Variospora aurantia]|nr:MAG: hypothetical protein LQ341_006119 [Variospora aurantia]